MSFTLTPSSAPVETHWIVRTGDGTHFRNASKYKIWGFKSSTDNNKYFSKNVRPVRILIERFWKNGGTKYIVSLSKSMCFSIEY